MALRLPDRWLWDFWFAQSGADTHLFYLQAPRSLMDAEMRHWNVTIGHAVSQDLRTWVVLPDALQPSPADSDLWDNYTTWTGSIICHAERWYMFYTGTRQAERGLIQRIGMAASTDLIHWEKSTHNPLIEADPRWYELLDRSLWHDQAWRDPHVFMHPRTGEIHALITGRANHGPADGRGVIAHAVSQDLLDWDLRPPVLSPGDFGHMEVPQWTEIDGRSYLLFSATIEVHSSSWKQRTGRRPVTGTYYRVSDDPLGPYESFDDEPLVGDPSGTYFSGKLIRDASGKWQFLAFRLFDTDGAFVGELSDPMPVTIESSGRLTVQVA